MLIHAFRRTAATSVDTGNTHIEFKPNDKGHVVAEVDDEADVEVLLRVPEAFKLYEPEPEQKPAKAAVKAPSPAPAPAPSPAPAPASDKPESASAFYLKGKTPADDLDLALMNEDELKAFAKANNVQVHYTWTGDKLDKLRQKLVDTFATE